MTDTTNPEGVEQFAPAAENYIPAPKFKYAPNQKEIDFSQIIASGGDLVDALSIASLITAEEKEAATRSQLYAMGTRLLNNPAIQERIDFYLVLHKASMDISAERIQQELAAISFADIAECFDESGQQRTNIRKIPRHVRAAIKEYFIDKDGIMRVKFHDKLKAVRTLGEMEGHFDEANRAKAPQVNISIGDGKGLDNRVGVSSCNPSSDRDIIDITPEDDPMACLE